MDIVYVALSLALLLLALGLVGACQSLRRIPE